MTGTLQGQNNQLCQMRQKHMKKTKASKFWLASSSNDIIVDSEKLSLHRMEFDMGYETLTAQKAKLVHCTVLE